MPDENLRQFCTEIQWKTLESVEKNGINGAARELGRNRTTIQYAVKAVEAKAAKAGYAPDHDMTHTAPPGFDVKGTSTYYDADGNKTAQWVKTDRDKEQQLEYLRQAVEDLVANAPRYKPVPPPKQTAADLLNAYICTDYHMGMLAWHREGGEDWDVRIATETLIGSFSQMMALSPDSETGFICQLGDFLHTDYPALAAATPISSHGLDVDGRPHKVISATIEVLRAIIDMALTKHKKVIVLMAEGNHDLVSSIWLQCLYAALYEKDKRVEVINSPNPYYAYQHGSTALFFHHGHMSKLPSLPGIFAAQFSEIWGQTKFRYGHAGHLHHKIRMDEKEDMGISITQHRTLSAKDAYSSRRGYFSERKAECITYSKRFGQVASIHVSPEMLK